MRFLVTVIAGWIGVRAVLLWPEREPASIVAEAAAATRKEARPAATAAMPVRLRVGSVVPAIVFTTDKPKSARPDRAGGSTFELAGPVASATSRQTPIAPGRPTTEDGSLPSPVGIPNRDVGSRWSGSLFAIARPSGAGGGLGSSQLGGSQAGARIAYALNDARRIALVGRVATPLEGRGREAALGIEWRPAGLPVHVFGEQRFALGAGRGGPSLGVIAGIDRTFGRGFRLEAYGQAGAIKRDRTEGFADGAARVTRPVARFGAATLDVGAGAWGGAQRGGERLDIGPTLGIAAPVAGRTLRLTVDWRERVVGNARPGSGPAVSIGADF
ncbi:hypothetical protein [uncultured Sphingomonas sp.]|uniref:hypothetical protein n=1 Tax=uncultured Sphingomonas sp. TaxID=158754 RepID=UPI0035CACDD2